MNDQNPKVTQPATFTPRDAATKLLADHRSTTQRDYVLAHFVNRYLTPAEALRFKVYLEHYESVEKPPLIERGLLNLHLDFTTDMTVAEREEYEARLHTTLGHRVTQLLAGFDQLRVLDFYWKEMQHQKQKLRAAGHKDDARMIEILMHKMDVLTVLIQTAQVDTSVAYMLVFYPHNDYLKPLAKEPR